MSDVERVVEEMLRKFWILDTWEYSVIKDLIEEQIERLDKQIKEFKSDVEDEIRMNNEDINLRDFFIVLKEKVSHIIQNGLCRQK